MLAKDYAKMEEAVQSFLSNSKPKIKVTEKMRNVASLVLVIDKNLNLVKSLKNRDADKHHVPSLGELLMYMQTTPHLKILTLDENGYVFSSNYDVIPYI